MDRRRTMLSQRCAMLRGPVPLVPGEAILWVLPIEGLHNLVQLDLGDDRRRRDRQAQVVTVGDRFLRSSQLGNLVVVHEDVVGLNRQRI
jgi:hypothetical protein